MLNGDEKPSAPRNNATIPAIDRQRVCQARILSFSEDGYNQRPSATRTEGKAHLNHKARRLWIVEWIDRHTSERDPERISRTGLERSMSMSTRPSISSQFTTVSITVIWKMTLPLTPIGLCRHARVYSVISCLPTIHKGKLLSEFAALDT